MKITQNGQYPFYRPWDSGLAKQSLQDSWEGEFSILDLQLGSACNAHCRHCDSSCSSLHESADLDINEVVRLLGEMRQSRNYFSPEHQSEPLWCFICGLGEPTEPTENLPKLLELLDRTAEIGVNFALFNMSSPDPFDLGDFRNYSYREIANLILDYRVEHIEKVRSAQTDYPEMVFGGCGGNARPLLRQYLESYDHWYASQCR